MKKRLFLSEMKYFSLIICLLIVSSSFTFARSSQKLSQLAPPMYSVVDCSTLSGTPRKLASSNGKSALCSAKTKNEQFSKKIVLIRKMNLTSNTESVYQPMNTGSSLEHVGNTPYTSNPYYSPVTVGGEVYRFNLWK